MSNPIEGLLTKEQTDLIFNNMSDGVIMVNEEGIITYMNSASARAEPASETISSIFRYCLTVYTLPVFRFSAEASDGIFF